MRTGKRSLTSTKGSTFSFSPDSLVGDQPKRLAKIVNSTKPDVSCSEQDLMDSKVSPSKPAVKAVPSIILEFEGHSKEDKIPHSPTKKQKSSFLSSNTLFESQEKATADFFKSLSKPDSSKNLQLLGEKSNISKLPVHPMCVASLERDRRTKVSLCQDGKTVIGKDSPSIYKNKHSSNDRKTRLAKQCAPTQKQDHGVHEEYLTKLEVFMPRISMKRECLVPGWSRKVVLKKRLPRAGEPEPVLESQCFVALEDMWKKVSDGGRSDVSGLRDYKYYRGPLRGVTEKQRVVSRHKSARSKRHNLLTMDSHLEARDRTHEQPKKFEKKKFSFSHSQAIHDQKRDAVEKSPKKRALHNIPPSNTAFVKVFRTQPKENRPEKPEVYSFNQCQDKNLANLKDSCLNENPMPEKNSSQHQQDRKQRIRDLIEARKFQNTLANHKAILNQEEETKKQRPWRRHVLEEDPGGLEDAKSRKSKTYRQLYLESRRDLRSISEMPPKSQPGGWRTQIGRDQGRAEGHRPLQDSGQCGMVLPHETVDEKANIDKWLERNRYYQERHEASMRRKTLRNLDESQKTQTLSQHQNSNLPFQQIPLIRYRARPQRLPPLVK